MNLPKRLFLILSSFFTLCQTQRLRYPVQETSYSAPSTSSAASSYYNRLPNPSYAHSYYKELAKRNTNSFDRSIGAFSSYHKQPIRNKGYYRSSSSQPYYTRNLSNGFPSTKQYLSNSYNSEPSEPSSTNNNEENRISKADAENAKFVGAKNQENNDGARTLHFKRRKFHHRLGGVAANPCYPYGRDAGYGITPPPNEQGRFLWGVKVYNIYPQTSLGLGCGGYGGFGGGLGGGLLSDPISPTYYPPGAGIANFLGLFAPGVLQNSLAVTARPQQFDGYGQSPINNDLQNDPEVDPNYGPGPASVPVRRPNSVFYDSAGAPPVTPAQLVGGLSTTVNGIIQQLTGNVQPVYG